MLPSDLHFNRASLRQRSARFRLIFVVCFDLSRVLFSPRDSLYIDWALAFQTRTGNHHRLSSAEGPSSRFIHLDCPGSHKLPFIIMSTDWSLDFCIVCDRQTLGGAYCSQACRLAEIDRYSSDSEPSSPTTTDGFNQPWKGFSWDNGRTQAFDWTPSSKTTQKNASLSCISAIFSKASRPGLTPSSSQTSLSSINSSSSNLVVLSGQIKSELEDYAGCFDQVRDWKRRLTLS